MVACTLLDKKQHSIVSSLEFTSMSRMDQNLVCKNCHSDLYDRFEKDPHFNAYKHLMEHVKVVEQESFGQPEYLEVLKEIESCIGCHAPKNLFETIFPTEENEIVSFVEQLSKKNIIVPEGREEEASRIMGVDCISCHVGNGQIYGGSKKKNGSLNSCAPVYSEFMANDLGCAPCHTGAVKTKYNNHFETIRNSNSCLSACHQDFIETEQGRQNSHLFVRLGKDSLGNKLLHDDITISKKDKALIVKWINNDLPHLIDVCPEVLLTLKLSDDAENFQEDTIYFNRRHLHDPLLKNYFTERDVPGNEGIEFPAFSDSFVYHYNLEGLNFDPKFIEYSTFFKHQYWFPDTFGIKEFSKKIELQ